MPKITKSIVIIGGTGFIGINLANYFYINGYTVLIIGRSKIPTGKLVSNKIKTEYFDVIDTISLVKSITDFENIIWLVTNLIPNSSLVSIVDDFKINIKPLIAFLEKSTDFINLQNFIFMSSGGTIYGNSFNNRPVPSVELSSITSTSAIGHAAQIPESSL